MSMMTDSEVVNLSKTEKPNPLFSKGNTCCSQRITISYETKYSRMD